MSSNKLGRIAAERSALPSEVGELATLRRRGAQPDADELELTVLGDWFGESLCVHLGDGHWMVVDSFKRTKHERPAALEYLDQLGVPLIQVRTLLVTHWDADHIDGVSDIAQECPDARVFVTAAMDPELFYAVLSGQSDSDQQARNALAELCKIIKVLDARKPIDELNKLHFAVRNLPLHQTPTRSAVVSTLTPTVTTTHKGFAAFGDFVRRAREGEFVDLPPRIGMGSHEKNFCSVAAIVHAPDAGILLGADLEHVETDEDSTGLDGWNAAAAPTRIPSGMATLVKVPHHGSDTGWCDALWGHDSPLVRHPAPAILAPWRNGNRGPLPDDTMVARLSSVASSLWSASTRRTVNVKTSSATIVERCSDSHEPPLVARPYGRVTARLKSGVDADWVMTADGQAAFWNGTQWQRSTASGE